MNDNVVLPFKRKEAAKELTPEELAEIATREEVEKRLEVMRELEAAGEPDAETVRLLEMMLESAKKGEVSGFTALAWSPKGKGFNRYNTVSRASKLDNTIDVFAMTMLGGLKLLAYDLEQIAFYRERLAAMHELVSDEGNGG